MLFYKFFVSNIRIFYDFLTCDRSTYCPLQKEIIKRDYCHHYSTVICSTFRYLSHTSFRLNNITEPNRGSNHSIAMQSATEPFILPIRSINTEKNEQIPRQIYTNPTQNILISKLHIMILRSLS
jgi:hypothetical protein